MSKNLSTSYTVSFFLNNAQSENNIQTGFTSLSLAYPVTWRADFLASFMDNTFESDRYLPKSMGHTPLKSILLDTWNTILATETWNIATFNI
jgi:hypothetical protein